MKQKPSRLKLRTICPVAVIRDCGSIFLAVVVANAKEHDFIKLYASTREELLERLAECQIVVTA